MPHRAIVCELVAANPGRFNYPKRELERWKCRQVAFSEDSILPGTIACNAATRDPPTPGRRLGGPSSCTFEHIPSPFPFSYYVMDAPTFPHPFHPLRDRSTPPLSRPLRT